MASTPMRKLFWRFYLATRGVHLYPGIYIWAFGDNRRIIPFPMTKHGRQFAKSPAHQRELAERKG